MVIVVVEVIISVIVAIIDAVVVAFVVAVVIAAHIQIHFRWVVGKCRHNLEELPFVERAYRSVTSKY